MLVLKAAEGTAVYQCMCCACINFYFNGRESPGRLVLEITLSFKLVAELSIDNFRKSAVKYF